MQNNIGSSSQKEFEVKDRERGNMQDVIRDIEQREIEVKGMESDKLTPKKAVDKESGGIMRFNLNKDWAVITDNIQVVVAKRHFRKEGREELVQQYYYNNFENAINGIIDRDIQSLEQVEDIADRIDTLKKDVKIMLTEVEKAMQEYRLQYYKRRKIEIDPLRSFENVGCSERIEGAKTGSRYLHKANEIKRL